MDFKDMSTSPLADKKKKLSSSGAGLWVWTWFDSSPSFPSVTDIEANSVCSALSQGAHILTGQSFHSCLFPSVHCQVSAYICPNTKQIWKVQIRGTSQVWEKLIRENLCAAFFFFLLETLLEIIFLLLTSCKYWNRTISANAVCVCF